MADTEITWQAPEFEERAKGVAWYWITILVAVAFLGIAVWQRNFLFGFFVAVAEILILVWGNRAPRTMDFVLNDKGVRIGSDRFSAFRDIESFSVDERGEWPKVILNFKSRIRPPLVIPVPKERRELVVRAVRLFVPQTDHDESLLDALQNFLGF